jgi:hypothetical protein
MVKKTHQNGIKDDKDQKQRHNDGNGWWGMVGDDEE